MDMLKHLNNIVEQGYTICDVNMTTTICAAAQMLGIDVRGGAYDDKTKTRVLYIEQH